MILGYVVAALTLSSAGAISDVMAGALWGARTQQIRTECKMGMAGVPGWISIAIYRMLKEERGR